MPLLATLTIPIYLVRFYGISRAFARYAEHMVSHDLTFEPRSGDLLSRIVGEVEELENLYVRALSPIIVAGAVSALTFSVLYIFDPLMAWIALGFLALTGVGVPLLVGSS